MTTRTGYDLREGAQMIRDRILAATGPCVGFERERHVDLIAEQVLRARGGLPPGNVISFPDPHSRRVGA